MFFKKLSVVGVALSMVATAVLPAVALAQTASIQETITQLQKKIQELNDQIRQLSQQRSETVQELVRTLRQGVSGDDVKALQALLSVDPEVYPEGMITGYYGRLTAAAVKRFQKKHGFEQVGIVGPKTLKKLNEQLQETPVALEDSDDDDDGDDNKGKKPCAIVPPGHLIAPGWLRKHGGQRPIVPLCQKLPPGIEKKLVGGSTTTPPLADVIAPVLSGVTTSGTTASSTSVSWNTNEPTTGKVYYGTTAPLNLSSAPSVSDSVLSNTHSNSILGLTASTTYYYVVEARDASANVATSSQQSFMTSQ